MDQSGRKPSGTSSSVLRFKGEDVKLRRKRRLSDKGPSVVSGSAAAQPAERVLEVSPSTQFDDQPPLIDGVGRLVTSSTTIHGVDTMFKDQVEMGDSLLVRQPFSLETELRTVVAILSQRSCTVHQAFSRDISSTTEFQVRKDSVKLRAKAAAAEREAEAESRAQGAAARAPAEELDAAGRHDAAVQRELDRKLRKQRKLCIVREKSGMWGYKAVTRKMRREASQEELLDERCKQGRDKWCS